MRNAREYYGVSFQCTSMVYDDNDGQEEDCVSLPQRKWQPRKPGATEDINKPANSEQDNIYNNEGHGKKKANKKTH